MKSFRSLLLKMQLLGGRILCCFLFCLLLLSPILSHQYALRFFISGEVDSWNLIRFISGGYTIFEYHLIFLHYIHIFSFPFLNWYGGSFLCSFICCSSEDNIYILFLNPLYLEDNHRIIVYGLFYLNRCNGVAFYPIDFFCVGSGQNLYGGSTYLSVCG